MIPWDVDPESEATKQKWISTKLKVTFDGSAKNMQTMAENNYSALCKLQGSWEERP